MKVLEGNGLRADVPAAEGVILVAANVQMRVGLVVRRERILNTDLDATDRFAEIAGAIMTVGGAHDMQWRTRESLS
jgi:hypothetical protein